MDLKIPGYELVRTIGKGGMATVYLAKQSVLERNVALKVMSRNLADDPEFGKRFMSEARIVSQLVHPNIVTVYDVGQFEGRYFLSMEYIDGYDLRSRKSKLDIAGKIRVIEDIARALHYAGGKGYVHRDIKPENIMFRSGDGSAVLTDFGIAKAVESDLSVTQTGTALGTPHYMSPEQAKGKEVDPRSDLYSLGIVFYQLLVGRVPYDGESAVAIGIKHITESLPVLPPGLQILQPVLDSLLSKNKEHRYPNGLALLNDLRKIDFHDLEAGASAEASRDAELEYSETQVSEVTDNADDTDRFTLTNMPVTERQEIQPGSRGAAFFSTIFVLLAVVFFVYMARPTVLEPYIARAEQEIKPILQLGRDIGSQISDNLPELDSGAQPVAQDGLDGGLADSHQQTSEGENQLIQEGKVARAPDTSASDIPEKQYSEDASASEQIDVPTIPSLQELKSGIAGIKESVRVEPLLVEEYIKRHRELLEFYPDDVETLSSLADIRASYEQEIADLIEQSRFDKARSRLTVFSGLFPEVDASRIAYFSARIDRDEQVGLFLEQAEENIANQRISAPKGNNAIDSLLSVLQIDAENQQAINDLNNISNEFIGKAELAVKNSDIPQGLDYVNSALRAFPENPTALELKSKLQAEQRRLAQVTDALGAAKKYSELGYLYMPEGGSAYDEFVRALSLDPENQTARTGLDSLIDLLSVKVWDLVGEAKFEAARVLLARPMRLMPENARLEAMHTAIDEVDAGVEIGDKSF